MTDVINTNFYHAKRRSVKLVLNELVNIPFSIIGDQQRITQVCNNLVNNAIKF
jgi:signal transduction histidine kinase